MFKNIQYSNSITVVQLLFCKRLKRTDTHFNRIWTRQTSVSTHTWIRTGTLPTYGDFSGKNKTKHEFLQVWKNWLYSFNNSEGFFFAHLEIRKEFVEHKRNALHWRRHVLKTQKINQVSNSTFRLKVWEKCENSAVSRTFRLVGSQEQTDLCCRYYLLNKPWEKPPYEIEPGSPRSIRLSLKVTSFIRVHHFITWRYKVPQKIPEKMKEKVPRYCLLKCRSQEAYHKLVEVSGFKRFSLHFWACVKSVY